MRTLINIMLENFNRDHPNAEILKKSVPWSPTQQQLDTAQALADAFYQAGHEDDYSFDQFRDDLDNTNDQIANDDGPYADLSGLTEEMGFLLYSYGEYAEWSDLSLAGYKAWCAE